MQPVISIVYQQKTHPRKTFDLLLLPFLQIGLTYRAILQEFTSLAASSQNTYFAFK